MIPPDSAHLDEFIPPSFEVPSAVRVVSRVVYAVPVEYVGEDVIIQFVDSRARCFITADFGLSYDRPRTEAYA